MNRDPHRKAVGSPSHDTHHYKTFYLHPRGHRQVKAVTSSTNCDTSDSTASLGDGLVCRRWGRAVMGLEDVQVREHENKSTALCAIGHVPNDVAVCRKLVICLLC